MKKEFKEDKFKMEKKTYGWIFPVIFYAAVICGILLVAYTVHINNKELRCLRPYAEKFCMEKNHSYIDHNLVYMTCTNEEYDPRMVGSSNIIQYWFNDSEKDVCGVER